MAMVEQTCWCGRKFQARKADVKRGWAKACSKSHAAHAREKALGRFGHAKGSGRIDYDRLHELAMDEAEQGWDAHKDAY